MQIEASLLLTAKLPQVWGIVNHDCINMYIRTSIGIHQITNIYKHHTASVLDDTDIVMSSTKVIFCTPRIRLWPTTSNGGATGIAGCLLWGALPEKKGSQNKCWLMARYPFLWMWLDAMFTRITWIKDSSILIKPCEPPCFDSWFHSNCANPPATSSPWSLWSNDVPPFRLQLEVGVPKHHMRALLA